MELSLVIVTYNRADSLKNALESIAGVSTPRDQFEVVVVDNRCTDHTQQVCEEFARSHPEIAFRCVTEPQQGVSHARNRGVAEARGAIISMVDDDETVPVDFIEVYLDFFASHPDALAAGGKMLPVYAVERLPRWFSPLFDRSIGSKVDLGDRDRLFPQSRYPMGGNYAVRREVFERFGTFSPDLGRNAKKVMGGEEKDFFDRIRRGGVPVYYLAASYVWHHIPASRVSKEYTRRLFPLMGQSERVRTLSVSKAAYVKRCLAEIFKWGATCVLMLWYLLTLRPAKGWAIVEMRTGITKGLLGLSAYLFVKN